MKQVFLVKEYKYLSQEQEEKRREEPTGSLPVSEVKWSALLVSAGGGAAAEFLPRHTNVCSHQTIVMRSCGGLANAAGGVLFF